MVISVHVVWAVLLHFAAYYGRSDFRTKPKLWARASAGIHLELLPTANAAETGASLDRQDVLF